MLGIGGRFVGAKGMVAVPNLSGLSRAQAQTAITNAGLVFFEESLPVDTTNQSLDGIVSGQSVAAGILIDYDSLVSYSYQRYVAPPPSGPVLISTERITSFAYGTTCECNIFTYTCTPYEQVQVSYRYTYSNGNVVVSRAPGEDGPLVYSPNDRTYAYNSPICGYVPPPVVVPPVVVCVPVQNLYSEWTGSCINNQQIYAYRTINSCTGQISDVISISQACCSNPGSTLVTSWTGSCIGCYRLTAERYRDNCTGVETIERGSVYCCSGGPSGGGAGGQIAL